MPRPSRRPALPDLIVSNRAQQHTDFLTLDEKSLDPSRHYRWVRCRSDEHMIQITQTKLKGYDIEHMRAGGPIPLAGVTQRPDKVIAIGDLVLMSCPKLDFEQREYENAQYQDYLLDSLNAETEETAKMKGVTLMKDHDHGRVVEQTKE